MELVKKVISSSWLYVIGAVVGAIAGYVYYIEVGCLTGSCPIKSDPMAMTIWGAVMGALVFSLFKRKNKK